MINDNNISSSAIKSRNFAHASSYKMARRAFICSDEQKYVQKFNAKEAARFLTRRSSLQRESADMLGNLFTSFIRKYEYSEATVTIFYTSGI